MARKKSRTSSFSVSLRDYWFLTVTAGIVAGFSIQQFLFLLPSIVGIGDSLGTPGDFVLQQVTSSVIGVLIAVLLLAVRKPRS